MKNPIVPLWFLKWYAPKGQKLLAQGSALGVLHSKAKRPVRAKAFIIVMLLPLQGALFGFVSVYPGLGAIWALPFRFAPATFGSARIIRLLTHTP